jgi:tetratricopeptide (TPR) repeat protein
MLAFHGELMLRVALLLRPACKKISKSKALAVAPVRGRIEPVIRRIGPCGATIAIGFRGEGNLMRFSALPLVSIACLAIVAAPSAQAAVTVLGNGVAHSCYEFAEFGGNPTDGINTCTFALEQTTLSVRDRAATFVNRGILRARREDADGALADYDRGLAMDASLAEGYVDRGAVMIVLRRYDDAVAEIDKGISLGANRLQIAYYDRAIADEALGNIRAAYEDYKKAAQIQPDFKLAVDQLSRFRVVRHDAGN